MDTRTGRIYPSLAEVAETDKLFCIEMNVPPSRRQLANMKVRRNDICPCGSGKKFKFCCLDKNLEMVELTALETELQSG